MIPNNLIEFSLSSGQSVFMNGRIFCDIDSNSLSYSGSSLSISVMRRLRPWIAARGTLSIGDLRMIFEIYYLG